MALAGAIGEDYKELSESAAGKKATKGWTANSLKQAIVKMVENEGVGESVRLIIDKPTKTLSES
jgi:hypothetical protein